MTEIEKQLSVKLMCFDSCNSERERYELLTDIENLVKEEKLKIINNQNNFSNAYSIFMNDITGFLNSYKDLNKLTNWDQYEFEYFETDRPVRRGYFSVINKGDVNLKGLVTWIKQFPKYKLLEVIGVENADKAAKHMTNEEYDKFLKIREENSLYFIPSIQPALDIMNKI